MRHSRRAVMAERYKLYMKKNVLNGKYFVRNLQIGICTIAVGALVAGAVAVSHFEQGDGQTAANAGNSVKEALFGRVEEEYEVTKEPDTEEAASSTTEQAATEFAMAEVTTQETQDSEAYVRQEEPVVKSEFDGKCIANVEESLNIRKEPSTDAEFVGSMNNGAIAIVEDTEGEWTKIKSGEVEGYVLTEYILTGESAETLAAEHVTLVGTVLEDGVNIRTEQSTDANILTVLNKDDTISVLENPDAKGAGNGKETTEQPEDESQKEAAGQTEEIEKNDSTEQFTDGQNESVTEQTAEEQKQTTAQQSTAEETKQGTAEQADETSEIAETEEVEADTTTEADLSETVEEVVTVSAQQQEEETKQTDTQAVSQDSITWISVMLDDGQVGYVSADLVDVDKLYEVAVSAEELQRKAAEEEAARRAAEEEAARQAAEAEAARQAASGSSNDSTGSSSSSSGDSSSYTGAVTTPVTATASGECLGTFTITAYCGCSQCSGGHNITASGTTPTEGRTIAADTSILPFGTQVVIDGIVYTVEDCGSGVVGNHIDIFFASHDSALAFGRRSVKVYKY